MTAAAAIDDQCAMCGRSNAHFTVETYYRGAEPDFWDNQPDAQIRPAIRICVNCIDYISMPGGALDEAVNMGKNAFPTSAGDIEA
jgi:hypothetical protein